tara:strand:- start:24 stop:404 length:381 start_codon:yes stop_codon:yes gene_type:complete
MSESDKPSENSIESLVNFIRKLVEKNPEIVDYRVKNHLEQNDVTGKLDDILKKDYNNQVNYIELGKEFYNKEVYGEGISEVGGLLDNIAKSNGGRKSRKTYKKKSKASKKKKSQRRRKSNRKSRRR